MFNKKNKGILYVAIVFVLIVILIMKFNKNICIFHYDSNPSFNREGNKILLSLNYPQKKIGQIYIIDLNGNVLSKLTNDSNNHIMPSYSKDNKLITYVISNDYYKGSNIWIKNLISNKVLKITNSKYFDGEPNFSDDKSKILFQRASWLRRLIGNKVWRNWDVWEYDFGTQNEYMITTYNFHVLNKQVYGNTINEIYFSTDLLTDDYLFKYDKKFNKINQVISENVSAFGFNYSKSEFIYFNTDTNAVFLMDENKNKYDIFKPTGNEFVLEVDLSSNGKKALIYTELYISVDKRDFKLYLVNVKSKVMKEIKIKTEQIKRFN